ncbi:hypothetical protein [Rugamonas sp.]|uniref:hypothetical protein n=1 Tax=Rugamonas sp. TaxID=1926287 RepID=UPI0025DF60EF|nr:hypothetical protein [Rugamonas sp.]
MNDRVKYELLKAAAAQAVTMSSIELVDIINEMREPGSAELRHDNFMVKIEKHPGITSPKFLGHVQVPGPNGSSRQSKCYHLPKRESELMVMSESLAVQTKVYDRLVELESGMLPVQQTRRSANPSLDSFRQARALEITTRVAAELCAKFPALGLPAQQGIYAALVNTVAGQDVMPLPTIEKMISATEVGKIHGISKNAVGKLANEHGLKIPQYGEFMLDKSRSSDKQMPSFRYNAAGVARIGELVRPKGAAAGTQGQLDMG